MKPIHAWLLTLARPIHLHVLFICHVKYITVDSRIVTQLQMDSHLAIYFIYYSFLGCVRTCFTFCIRVVVTFETFFFNNTWFSFNYVTCRMVQMPTNYQKENAFFLVWKLGIKIGDAVCVSQNVMQSFRHSKKYSLSILICDYEV